MFSLIIASIDRSDFFNKLHKMFRLSKFQWTAFNWGLKQ